MNITSKNTMKKVDILQLKDKYLTYHVHNKNTYRKYNSTLIKFNSWLDKNNKIPDKVHINDILNEYLQNYLLREKELSKNTVQQHYVILKKFITTMTPLHVEKLNLPKKDYHKPVYLTDQEITIVLHYATGIDELIINLLASTGLRIHEALQITIDDLKRIPMNKDGNYMLTIIGKGNKPRTIALHETLYNKLLQYANEHNNKKYIFESHDNRFHPTQNTSQNKPATQNTTIKSITPRTINRHMKKLGSYIDKQEGYSEPYYSRKLQCHNLRHSAAVHSLNYESINFVQKMLGHSNISTTQIYVDINDETLSTKYSNIPKWD